MKANSLNKEPDPRTIAHESEIHRQYIRIELPAAAVIDGKSYKIKNISAGGFSIYAEGDIHPEAEGIQDIKILFPFQNFSLHLTLKAHPVFKSKATNTIGYQYDELTPRQTSLLQYVVKSYVTGQIIREGDLIGVAIRENHAPLRDSGISNDNYTRKKLARILAIGTVGLVFLSSLAFFASSIYENSAIVKSYTGLVHGEVFTVRSTASGVFTSLLAEGAEQVTKDQAIATIQPVAPAA